MSAPLAEIFLGLVGPDAPVSCRACDGSAVERPDAVGVVELRSPRAVRYLATAPGELGLARAYVTGEVEIDGDLHDTLLAMRAHARPRAEQLALLTRLRPWMLRRPPLPEEELPARRRRGSRAHTRERDARAIAHHYDLSNDFYEILLGPSMAYSCAVFPRDDASLLEAQREKFDLICRKLELRPGHRLLDVGAGWGGLVIHAAEHYGAHALGVTLSGGQAARAQAEIERAGLSARASVIHRDYRDVHEGGFHAISSVGAMEHFGARSLGGHFAAMAGLLLPQGRMLNHAITRPSSRVSVRPGPFIDRYIFPDGELESPAAIIGAMHDNGFEVRHEESLREHYARTLGAWSENLEVGWERAVAEVGLLRARAWRLYLAISRIGFELNLVQIHQVLAVNTDDDGRSGMPLRPNWERARRIRPEPLTGATPRERISAGVRP